MQPLHKAYPQFPPSFPRSQTTPPQSSGSRAGPSVLTVRNTGRGATSDTEDVIKEYEEKRDR